MPTETKPAYGAYRMTFNELKQKVRDASDAPASPAREDLCDACGAPACDCPGLTSIRAPHPTNYAYKSAGLSRIRLCAKCWDSTAEECIQAIRARRRSLAQPAEEFKFQVGDRVSVSPHPDLHSDWHGSTGVIVRFQPFGAKDPIVQIEGNGLTPACPVASLRLIRRAPQAEVKPVESKCDHSWEYRNPVDVCRKCGIDALEAQGLPKRAPTVAADGLTERERRCIRCTTPHHPANHVNADGICDHCQADLMNLANTKKACAACLPGNPCRAHDPFVADPNGSHHLRRPAPSSDTWNRIAATRAERDAKKRAQALEDLDRPAHPRSFPEGAFWDAEEIYVS